jgi:hypothetical protein
MESLEFGIVVYFDLCFQWFKPSLRFRPRWLNRFISSCGVFTSVWNISILRIWNGDPVSFRRTAAPCVSTHN